MWWALAVAGAALAYALIAHRWSIRDSQNLGRARVLVGIRDAQIKKLEAANKRLRSPIESPVERMVSGAAELAARGLSPDGTPID